MSTNAEHGRVVAAITVSLDGYVTGPDDRPGQGLGVGGEDRPVGGLGRKPGGSRNPPYSKISDSNLRMIWLCCSRGADSSAEIKSRRRGVRMMR